MKKSIAQNTILVVRAKKEISENIQHAAEKFQQIYNTKIEIISSNINLAAERLEAGEIDVLFAETLMDKAEANYFLSCLDRCKRIPFILCTTDNYDKIHKKVPADRIYCQKSDFSKAFIFNSIRNLLAPTNQKIDIRYIKSILVSVIDVVQKNTQLEVKPSPINEYKHRETPEDFLSSVSFYGDGFLGSLTIRSSRKLMNILAEKIFLTSEGLDNNTLLDMLGEISQQILGVTRLALKDFGFELRNSLQIVCSGNQFLYNASSNGRYYEIPFEILGEKFNITFCYNNYRTTIHELAVQESANELSRLDIRIVTQTSRSIETILGTNVGLELSCLRIDSFRNSIIQESDFHIFHAAGWQGELTLALNMGTTNCRVIREKMLGVSTSEELDLSSMNDLLSELLNQIGGDLLKQLKSIGYNFQRIYQASFTDPLNLAHQFKIPGYLVRFEFLMGEQKFDVFLGIHSSVCPAYFDLWPILQEGITLPNSLAS